MSNVKDQFPIFSNFKDKQFIYFDNAATTQKPLPVLETMNDYYTKYNSNVHRGVHTLSMESTDLFEEARNRVAKFINSKNSESIIWTRNSTEGINLVSNSWGRKNIQPGDEILVNEVAPRPHNSGHFSIEACKSSQFQQHIRSIFNFQNCA